MKFHSRLTEGVFLKRVLRFLVEVVLPDRQKLIIRCPNLAEMRGCDILGTKLWYSSAIGYNCLPTWELAEVDGGELVSINPELIKPIVLEALKANKITELKGYTLLHGGSRQEQLLDQVLLLEKNKQQCYLALEQVIVVGSNGEGLFPPTVGVGRSNLEALIQARNEGHRAVLLFCATHTGVHKISPALKTDLAYCKMLKQATDLGVELLAYGTDINLDRIELSTPLPILNPETESTKYS